MHEAIRQGRIITPIASIRTYLLTLKQRDLDVMAEPERLCDKQALFLVEVLSQYRSRRAAKTLSNRFEDLYQKVDITLLLQNILTNDS